jgi:hypothetical protein
MSEFIHASEPRSLLPLTFRDTPRNALHLGIAGFASREQSISLPLLAELLDQQSHLRETGVIEKVDFADPCSPDSTSIG